MKKIFYVLTLVAVLCSCADQEGEWFDTPFVRIATSTGASSTVVLSDVRNVNTYSVYLSSTPLADDDSLTVSYEVVVGDGLVEDVDYKVVTSQNPLVFLPGIYDMPIRIRWLKNPVDPAKDNTVTIRLTANSKGYNLGYPGPDHKQSEVIIEKRNN
ncbi:MAG: hypothetical protein IJ559_01500 [Prevotella sp.]|nr:hypothetical protein [Prevotella sp.]MBR1394318.1 hypothetical protein [Prevotella sp.]